MFLPIYHIYKIRNRLTQKRARIQQSKRNDHKMTSVVEKSFKSKSSHPHVLMELSLVEFKRFQDNSIHLTGLRESSDKKEILYDNVTYGKNITKKYCKTNNKEQIVKSNELTVTRTKGRYVMITTTKKDCLSINQDLMYSTCTNNNHPSGVVVLMTMVYNSIGKNNHVWSPEDTLRLKKCKPNILVTSNHHGSTGYYTSFGNKASYDKAIDSSIGQYVSKKNSCVQKQHLIDQDCILFEQRASNEVERSVKDLSKIVPLVRNILSPIIKSAYKLQNKLGDIKLKENQSSSNGCWQKSICINAQTMDYHVEKDCTYTLITIPMQLNMAKEDFSRKYQFYFKLSNSQHIHIPLKSGISFFFSGTYLTHRQNKDEYEHTTANDYINIASYGNKRLFSHIRQSFKKLG
jgi:hypothetical protein